jgi:hypothetical protein
MALHGEIQVNGHGLGSWEAVRKEEDPVRRGRFRYQCEVRMGRGVPVDISSGIDRWRFTVWHDYTDGALVLAGKVLTIYSAVIPTTVEGDD